MQNTQGYMFACFLFLTMLIVFLVIKLKLKFISLAMLLKIYSK